MVNSRSKGSTFERQVAKLLEAELGIAFKRDLEQYRAGDHGDLIADDPDFPEWGIDSSRCRIIKEEAA